jgi:pimeloyl-ACP methyl ester carboxylesterase
MPVIGSALYRLNVANRVIAMMYRRHVFADPGRVTPAFVAEKARIARQRGGRFGTAAFVTGAIDPVQDRASFLDSVRRASAPVFVIYGATTPARSLAEMVALSGLPGVLSKCLPAGSLGLHEEHPRGVAELLRPFLLGVPRNLTKADASQVTPAG